MAPFHVLIECSCGRRPDEDIHVLLAQMSVLRDELVSRDRLLRQAQEEIERLRTRQLPSNRVPLFTSRDP